MPKTSTRNQGATFGAPSSPAIGDLNGAKIGAETTSDSSLLTVPQDLIQRIRKIDSQSLDGANGPWSVACITLKIDAARFPQEKLEEIRGVTYKIRAAILEDKTLELSMESLRLVGKCCDLIERLPGLTFYEAGQIVESCQRLEIKPESIVRMACKHCKSLGVDFGSNVNPGSSMESIRAAANWRSELLSECLELADAYRSLRPDVQQQIPWEELTRYYVKLNEKAVDGLEALTSMISAIEQIDLTQAERDRKCPCPYLNRLNYLVREALDRRCVDFNPEEQLTKWLNKGSRSHSQQLIDLTPPEMTRLEQIANTQNLHHQLGYDIDDNFQNDLADRSIKARNVSRF